MPAEGVHFKEHSEILSYEEIEFLVEVAADLGFSKVRLTGGEPLVRRGLPDLVALLRAIPGVQDISLTTNAILLPRFAAQLKEAGLDRVNISLDTLDPVRYARLTRGGSLEQALAGVEAAFEHHLEPVKINAVLNRETMEELPAFVELTRDRPLHVRFIEWMPVGSCGPSTEAKAPVRNEVIEALARLGTLLPADSPGGWGPARYFRLPGYAGTIGFISAVSDHFCADCNRLRLTADGRLMSCLFSNDEISIREALASRDREAVAALIRQSLSRKTFDRCCVEQASERGMSQIGG
jgi:cyclic pyranopterin phosphate synthase